MTSFNWLVCSQHVSNAFLCFIESNYTQHTANNKWVEKKANSEEEDNEF